MPMTWQSKSTSVWPHRKEYKARSQGNHACHPEAASIIAAYMPFGLVSKVRRAQGYTAIQVMFPLRRLKQPARATMKRGHGCPQAKFHFCSEAHEAS